MIECNINFFVGKYHSVRLNWILDSKKTYVMTFYIIVILIRCKKSVYRMYLKYAISSITLIIVRYIFN